MRKFASLLVHGERAARLCHMTIAEWVRQALVQVRRREPSREAASKLEVIRAAGRFDFPPAYIDRMVEEIEQGRQAAIFQLPAGQKTTLVQAYSNTGT